MNTCCTGRRRAVASLAALAVGAASLLASPLAGAQGYPERPVRIVSVSSAGTGVDDFTRLAAHYLSQKTGQNFLVENRPGANSILAADHVARATPDGYTLLLASASALTANPFLYKSLPYDANKDLLPVARLSVVPIVLVVPASAPYRDLGELLAAARARPGALSFGTSTTGYKVMTEAINRQAKVQAQEIPYKGSGNLLPDLLAARLDYAMLEVSQAVPQVKAGKVRPLAVSSPTRVAVLPGVPTLAEAGMADATLTSWLGLLAPAGTPQPIVDKLARLAQEFVESPEAKAHFAQRGTAAFPAGPAQFRTDILADQAKWKHYIEAAGIQPQ